MNPGRAYMLWLSTTVDMDARFVHVAIFVIIKMAATPSLIFKNRKF